MKNLLLILALFFFNFSFSNPYIEFKDYELEHFNKYYNYEDFSITIPKKGMKLDDLIQDKDLNFQRKFFLKKAKKNEEDSVFLTCKEDKWFFKDSQKEIFIVLNSLRSKAFLTTAGSYPTKSLGDITGRIYEVTSENQFYKIGTKPPREGIFDKLFVTHPFSLDTNDLMLSIYENYDNKFYSEIGSRRCAKMNYSKWLSRLLPLTDKIAKEQAATKERKKLKF
jgi:hypothetical protein